VPTIDVITAVHVRRRPGGAFLPGPVTITTGR
jgi:hypothetical protein